MATSGQAGRWGRPRSVRTWGTGGSQYRISASDACWKNALAQVGHMKPRRATSRVASLTMRRERGDVGTRSPLSRQANSQSSLVPGSSVYGSSWCRARSISAVNT